MLFKHVRAQVFNLLLAAYFKALLASLLLKFASLAYATRMPAMAGKKRSFVPGRFAKRSYKRQRASSAPARTASSAASPAGPRKAFAAKKKKFVRGFPKFVPKSIYALMGPQAFNPFNPMISRYHQGTLPTPNSIGNFTYMRTSATYNFSTGTSTQTDFIVLLWQPSCVVGWLFSNGGTCTEIKSNILNTNRPTQIRPARLGVKILNTTRSDQCGGLISVTETAQPLKLNVTSTSGAVDAATITSLKALIDDGDKCKRFTGQQAANKPIECFVRPASAQSFTEWQAYQDINLGTVTEQGLLNLGMLSQGTTAVVIGFHDTSASNAYTLQFIEEDMCRYPANELGAQLAIKPPALVGDQHFAQAASLTLGPQSAFG